MELVLRVAVVGVLAAIVAALFAPVALADTLCDYEYGSYCCNSTIGLRLVMTYKFQWHSERSYTNSVDALRQTAQQRGGSSSASWEMWEWALGSC